MHMVLEHKGGTVIFEKDNGWFRVTLRDTAGNLLDKVRCDNYRDALAYRRSFVAIAKAR